MSFILTCSGSSATASLVREAVDREGFSLVPDYPHGLTDEPGQSFVTVQAENETGSAARVRQIIKPEGWTLRAAHKPVDPDARCQSFPWRFTR